MSSVELYLFSSCSSCRNAEALLNELGVAYEKREYFKLRFSPEELGALLRRIGKTPTDVLSTRSRPYRELDLANRTLSDDELITLMIEHPQLLRRPLTVRGTDSVVGYNRSAIVALVEGRS